MRKPFALCLGLALITWLTAGCAPMVANRGNMVDDDRLAAIQEGVTRKDEVMSILGSPSASATFASNTWYYIGQVTETAAFSRPEAVERKVLVLKFDDAEVVQSKQLLTLADAQEVDPTDRTTPSP